MVGRGWKSRVVAVQDHVGVHLRIVSHLGSLKASRGLRTRITKPSRLYRIFVARGMTTRPSEELQVQTIARTRYKPIHLELFARRILKLDANSKKIMQNYATLCTANHILRRISETTIIIFYCIMPEHRECRTDPL